MSIIKGAILVTGANGGIGITLVKCLLESGYYVIATDKDKTKLNKTELDNKCLLAYIECNLELLITNNAYLDSFIVNVLASLQSLPLIGIVHNAAYQVINHFCDITAEEWLSTLKINLLAPVAISKKLMLNLKSSKGSIIHIGSIHSSLTKSGFTAYATSKAALAGLTRSMAVELGDLIRVNAIEPAAILTPMLKAGFSKTPEVLDQLNVFHPTKSIGLPEDVARSVIFLLDPANTFLNGCVLSLSGGIHCRLHDPI